MKTIIALFGAFVSAALLLVIVDIYTPGWAVLDLPLFVIFFVIWVVGFGYATIETNLKKKIVAVLIIEGLALVGSSGYFIYTRGFEREYIFGITLGFAAVIIMLLLKDKKTKSSEK
jgi:hypothetical protein